MTDDKLEQCQHRAIGRLRGMQRQWRRHDAALDAFQRGERDTEPEYPSVFLLGASISYANALAEYVRQLEARLGIDAFTKAFNREQEP